MTNKTSKNIKKITIMASLVLLSVMIMSLQIDNVYAESKGKIKEDILIEKYIKEKKSDDRIRMEDIHLKLKEEDHTTEEKENLEKEAEEIRQKAKNKLKNSLSADEASKHKDKKTKAEKHYEKLKKSIIKNNKFAKLFTNELVGFGIDDKTGNLFIDINPIYANQANADKYDKKLKKILGKDAKFDFKEIERPKHSTCTVQTDECRQIQGGVKITIGLGSCSVGFQAKDGDQEGFITAGHCGEIDDAVNQPFWAWQGVGEITRDGLTSSDTYTYCDCAFVNATGTNSVSDSIFSNINATDIGSIEYNDYLTLNGFASGAVSGQLKSTSYSTLIEGKWLLDQFRIDEEMASGDSGGPVYETGDSTPSLMGFHSATQGGFAIVSKASNLGTEMSGVSLDFD